MEHPVVQEIAKATPPAAVIATSWFYNVHWGDIAYFLTAVYTTGLIVQLVYRLYKWVKERKKHGSQS